MGFQLSYSPFEDRIVLRSAVAGETPVSFMISRRLWIEFCSALNSLGFPEPSAHEGKALEGRVRKNPLPDSPVLVRSIQLRRNDSAVFLIFKSDKEPRTLRLDPGEILKIREVGTNLAGKAGWDLTAALDRVTKSRVDNSSRRHLH